ncbi:MAG: hypothetical protein HC821_00605 [Lewinella sp.]|nr:hypothetical protein [Lewinella sp.]
MPTQDIYYIPQLQVRGTDSGIRHSFSITEDRFAQGDIRLINHRRYYFVAIAYGYNNYKQFDPEDRTDPANQRLICLRATILEIRSRGYLLYRYSTPNPRPRVNGSLRRYARGHPLGR